MPHALYLGSYLSTQDRISTGTPTLPPPNSSDQQIAHPPRKSLKEIVGSLFYMTSSGRISSEIDYRTPYGERDNNPLSFIRAHLAHGIADIVLSLLGFAVAINSA